MTFILNAALIVVTIVVLRIVPPILWMVARDIARGRAKWLR